MAYCWVRSAPGYSVATMPSLGRALQRRGEDRAVAYPDFVAGLVRALLPALGLLDRRPVLYAFTLAAPGAHTSHAREGGLAWDSSIG